jgi:excinuclease ABC subunit C
MSPEAPPDELSQKLESLPSSPGCYVFRDGKGGTLYVGKAKSLRSRVRSYFQEGASDTRAFIPFLRKHVADLETIVTRSEKEAAILENNLIKERKPRYNVKLRDDKEYLSVRLSLAHEWPRFELVRRPKPDGARYFGPYHSATAVRRTLHQVERHWKLRTCSDRELQSRKRPCLKYQIGRCPAPCVYEVDRELYAEQVRTAALFLEGRHDELTKVLRDRMAAASERLEFELAGTYRDQLAAVESVREAQGVVSVSDRDQDVVGLFREADLAELVVLIVRAGRVIDTVSFSSGRVELPDDEVIAAFLRDHYGEGGAGEAHLPDEVLVPVLPEGADGVAEWLSERRAAALPGARVRQVQLLSPQRGSRRDLLELAQKNAQHSFEEKRRAETDIDEKLARVKERLRLPTLPRRIECSDISHLGGEDTVGSVVALLNGKPDKKRYRTYHVRNAAPGDDYQAQYEVLRRRFARGRAAAQAAPPSPGVSLRDAPVVLDETNVAPDETLAVVPDETNVAPDETNSDLPPRSDSAPEVEPASVDSGSSDSEWQLPDLFVIDGGRGQLAVALAAAHDLGLHDLPIVGLAKERESELGEKLVDRVYLPGQKNPVPLRPNSPELFMLAFARDEAHRFANRGRKQTGKRRRFESALDRVKGLGEKTKKALLTELGSVEAVRQATDEQLLAVRGVSRRHVDALRRWVAGTTNSVG